MALAKLVIPRFKPPKQVRVAIRKKPAAIERVERAIVSLTRLKGRGVLVPGGYVLSAAHCIGWTCSGEMALEPDDHREPARTADGRKLSLAVYAVDPVSDIAVLGAVDAQRSWDESDEFDAWVQETAPVPIFTGKIRPWIDLLPLLALNQDRTWVDATAHQIVRAHQRILSFDTAAPIKGGASGGPVITPAGDLVGIVSSSRDTPNGLPSDATCVRLPFALPVWVANEIGVR